MHSTRPIEHTSMMGVGRIALVVIFVISPTSHFARAG
jgi:hypothetical protein